MPIRITELKDFLKRLEIEADTNKPPKFTWLIGAGMSASSGIPLASEVSERIMILEHIVLTDIDVPWDTILKKTYSEDFLDEYFDWFEVNRYKSNFTKDFLEPAISWIRQQPFFENVTIENPECYQLLFQHRFQIQGTSLRFLNKLIKRSKGINLAHLGLAGLLRDFPLWGTTVFTTNFDDLLLKSILQLDHSARVFGEYETDVLPGTDPNYPQIVYLHGKHTGYNLLNSESEVSLVNENLQAAFKNHISDTNLIVLGYSGWDDLAMKTLMTLSTNSELSRGNIFWIPWKSDETMLPEVKEFFNSLKKKTIDIIINENKSLDADLFMIELCNFLNSDNGGFNKYRGELLANAERQHSFVLSELEKYPQFSPEKVFVDIDDAKSIYYAGFKSKAKKKLEKARILLEEEDLDSGFRARGYYELGKCCRLFRMHEEGIEMFLESMSLSKMSEENRLTYTLTTQLYSELSLTYYELGMLEKSRKSCSSGLFHYDKYLLDDKELFIRLNLTFAKINLAKGYLDFNKNLRVLNEIFEESPDENQVDEYFLLLSWHHYLRKEYSKALQNANLAFVKFTERDKRDGIANTMLIKANLEIDNRNFEQAIENLEEAIEIFEETDNYVGIGCGMSFLGDVYKLMKENEHAEEKYKESLSSFNDVGLGYNIDVVNIDLLAIDYYNKNYDGLDERLQNGENSFSPYVKQSVKKIIEQIAGHEEE